MKPIVALLAALLLLGGARLVREAAEEQRAAWPKVVETPYAPAPEIAPVVALGYGEVAADLFYLRTRVYYGGNEETAPALRALIEAIIALDPHLEVIYEFAGRAISWVDGGVTPDDYLWAAQTVERGMAEFPDSWKLPKLAGEIYILDLETDDPVLRAEYDERGARLLEKAIRMPGAPKNLATLIAHVRSELGQHERAREGLIELIRTTDNEVARQRLIEKLAELEETDAQRLADEEHWMKERFERARKAALPEAPDDIYILLGDPPKPYIDLGDLSAPPDLGLDDEVYEPVE